MTLLDIAQVPNGLLVERLSFHGLPKQVASLALQLSNNSIEGASQIANDLELSRLWSKGPRVSGIGAGNQPHSHILSSGRAPGGGSISADDGGIGVEGARDSKISDCVPISADPSPRRSWTQRRNSDVFSHGLSQAIIASQASQATNNFRRASVRYEPVRPRTCVSINLLTSVHN